MVGPRSTTSRCKVERSRIAGILPPLPFDNLLPVVFMHVMNIWRYGATPGCVRRRCEAVQPGGLTAAAAYSNENQASVDKQTPQFLF